MATIAEMNTSLEDARWFHQRIDHIVRGSENEHDVTVVRRLFRGYLHCWKTVLHLIREARGLGRRKHDNDWKAWCIAWQTNHLSPERRAVMDQLRVTRDFDTHSGSIVVSGEVAAGLLPIVLIDPVEPTHLRRELVTFTNQGLDILERLLATHAAP